MSNTKNVFSQALKVANTGTKFPVLDLVKQDPAMAAVLSKLIKSDNPPIWGNDGNRTTVPPNTTVFKDKSDKLAQNIQDAETVMQVFPEIDLSGQILVSSILSPKDMMSTELNYAVTEGLMEPTIISAMLARSTLYFEQDYKIKPLLPDILKDMLFKTGSYAVAVIPENSIDNLINGDKRVTMEAMSSTINKDGSIKSIGILGPATNAKPKEERSNSGFSMESLIDYKPNNTVDGNVTLEGLLDSKPTACYLSVGDNTDVLKIPRINQKIREERIFNAIGSKAMESFTSKLNDREITGKLYKDRQFGYNPVSKLKTQEQLNRNTVGNPLILHLPSESIIPVYVPGCVEEQIGFFVLLDVDGNPISRTNNQDHYQNMGNRLNNDSNFASSMLNKARSQMSGFDTNNRDHLDFSVKLYQEMIEQDLTARLRNGVYGNGVALAKTDEIYRIMFARALAKQHTQLLFIPVELMTYFAFNHTPEGMGESLMDKMKILNSLRTMLLFSNVMASLKNSIGRTEVKIKLDESDPNPQKTIEQAKDEIVRTRSQSFPVGISSPAEITDFLQRASIDFTFEGHPGLPDVNVDFGEKNSNYAKPDTELSDSLRKSQIQGFGLTPENVDAGANNVEFATSILANNLLLSKRVMVYQDKFCPQLSSHMRKCMMNSEELITDLRAILMANFEKLELESNKPKKDANGNDVVVAEEKPNADTDIAKQVIVNKYLREFFMNFNVTLPNPNSITLENQLAGLKVYTEALEITLEAQLSEKFFTTDTTGEIGNQVAVIKEIVKAYYIRQYMSENGIMLELNQLTAKDADGEPVVDIFELQRSHITGLVKSLTGLMVGLKPIKEASDAVLAANGEEPTPEATPEPDSGSDGSTGGDNPDGDIPDFGSEDTPEDDGDAATKDSGADKPEGDAKVDTSELADDEPK
jgi:hypothetical protein